MLHTPCLLAEYLDLLACPCSPCPLLLTGSECPPLFERPGQCVFRLRLSILSRQRLRLQPDPGYKPSSLAAVTKQHLLLSRQTWIHAWAV